MPASAPLSWAPRRGQALLGLLGFALLGSGCQYLPELPSLPSLPRLPSGQAIREAVAPGTSGATLGEAILTSRALADGWSTSTPTLVDAQGKTIDPGGRNGGYKGGEWTIMWREPGGDRGLRVHLLVDKTASETVVVPPDTVDLGGRALDGLLDSPAALAAGGFGNVKTTVLLTRAGARARYNLVAEGEPKFALIDATTGQKVTP